MTFSGYQLRAARSLLGLDQRAMAAKVGVSIPTLQTMEACGRDPVGGYVSTREKVRTALEAAGIEFLNHGSPGVRLRGVGGQAPKAAVGPETAHGQKAAPRPSKARGGRK